MQANTAAATKRPREAPQKEEESQEEIKYEDEGQPKRASASGGQPRSRAAKRRKLAAQRDAEDAADWASICAMPDSDEDSDDEDGAGGD